MKRLALAALPLTLLAACGDDKPKPIDVKGVVMLKGDVGTNSDIQDNTQSVYDPSYSSASAAENDACEGTGGYNDIVDGGQVTIVDDNGKTMGLGSLKGGHLTSSGNYDNTCLLAFTVTDVDTSAKYYTVKVGHRDGPKYTLDDLKKGPQLSIG